MVVGGEMMDDYTWAEFMAASSLILQMTVIFYAIVAIHMIPYLNRRAWWVFISVSTLIFMRRVMLNLRLGIWPDIIWIEYLITDLISVGWIAYIYIRTKGPKDGQH